MSYRNKSGRLPAIGYTAAFAQSCIVNLFITTAMAMSSPSTAGSSSCNGTQGVAGVTSKAQETRTISITKMDEKEAKGAKLTPKITKIKWQGSFHASQHAIEQIGYTRRTECIVVRNSEGSITTWPWDVIMNPYKKEARPRQKYCGYKAPFAIAQETLIAVPNLNGHIGYLYPQTGAFHKLPILSPSQPIKLFLRLPSCFVLGLKDGTIELYTRKAIQCHDSKTNKQPIAASYTMMVENLHAIVALDATNIAIITASNKDPWSQDEWKIDIWDVERHKYVQHFQYADNGQPVYIAGLSNHSMAVQTATSIQILNWKTKEILHKQLLNPQTAELFLSFDPNLGLIPYVDDAIIFATMTQTYNNLHIWQPKDSTFISFKLPGEECFITAIAANLPYGYIAVGCDNGTIHLYA